MAECYASRLTLCVCVCVWLCGCAAQLTGLVRLTTRLRLRSEKGERGLADDIKSEFADAEATIKELDASGFGERSACSSRLRVAYSLWRLVAYALCPPAWLWQRRSEVRVRLLGIHT